jgi:hypothetical protein
MRAAAVVVLALLLVSASILAQQQATPEPDVRPFAGFTGKGIEALDHEFTVSGYKYTILSSGRGNRKDEKGSIRRFSLPLNGYYLDGQIYYADYRGDVLLICETSDSEYGTGFITRLDGRTLAMKWKRTIPGFNVGQGLLEGNHAYVTAIGFVGKVNLDTGVYAWKHDNLFRTETPEGAYPDTDFNSFKLPEVNGDFVLFKAVETYRPPAKTLKIQKSTGKIISDGP